MPGIGLEDTEMKKKKKKQNRPFVSRPPMARLQVMLRM